MSEKRNAKMTVNKAGSGSTTFRVTLPQKWVRGMGLNEEIRDLTIEHKDNAIIITKK